ncbi:type VI protein secretion system component VasF [Paenibacillus sp. OAS669]|nr:type VI protein secretion system component VasF [Paenibacillus sp. OAS669]
MIWKVGAIAALAVLPAYYYWKYRLWNKRV